MSLTWLWCYVQLLTLQKQDAPCRCDRDPLHRVLFPLQCYLIVIVLMAGPCVVGKVKVQCTLVQALRLCTDRTAHRGRRVIAELFLDHDTRREWGVSVTPRPLFTPGKDAVPIVQEAGWVPWPVWTGAENLAPTGIGLRTFQPVVSRYTDWANRLTPCGVGCI